MPHEAPCQSSRCIGVSGTLAALVFLLQDLTGTTTEELDNAVREYKTMIGDNQGLEHLVASFPDEAHDAITPDDVKCLECLSDIELKRRIYYLLGVVIESYR